MATEVGCPGLEVVASHRLNLALLGDHHHEVVTMLGWQQGYQAEVMEHASLADPVTISFSSLLHVLQHTRQRS